MKRIRTEDDIKAELKGILNSDDWKLRGFLLVWCILTGGTIISSIINNLFEPPINWIYEIVYIIFALPLLMMVLVGRGSRYLICVFCGILAIAAFWAVGVEEYIWEDEVAIEIMRVFDLMLGTYYGITALYFYSSKRAKERFICCKRKAELWRELEDTDRARRLGAYKDNEVEPKEKDDEDDIKEQLRKLKEQNKKLANRIDELEKRK